MTTTPPSDTFDYSAAAARLGVSVKWLQAQVQNRKVPCRRFGRLVRFTEQDLRDILDASRHAPVRRARK